MGTTEIPPKIQGYYDRVITQFDQMKRWAAEPEEKIKRRVDSVSGWSILEQLDHLAAADQFMVMAIESALLKPPKDAKAKTKLLAHAALFMGFIPRGKGKAPDATKPKAQSREQLMKSIDRSLGFVRALEPKLGDISTSLGRAPHPVFGPILASEWLRFMAIHHHHHFKIINDIERAK